MSLPGPVVATLLCGRVNLTWMPCGPPLPYAQLRCRPRHGGALHCGLCQRTPGRLSAHAAVRPTQCGLWWALSSGWACFPRLAGCLMRWGPSRRSGESRTPPLGRARGSSLLWSGEAEPFPCRSGWLVLPRLSVRPIEWLNHLIPRLSVSRKFIPNSSPRSLVGILRWISQGV